MSSITNYFEKHLPSAREKYGSDIASHDMGNNLREARRIMGACSSCRCWHFSPASFLNDTM
jgi:hypothetical protein